MDDYFIGDYIKIVTIDNYKHFIRIIQSETITSRILNAGVLLHSTNKNTPLFQYIRYIDKHSTEITSIEKIEDLNVKKELELKYKLYLLTKS